MKCALPSCLVHVLVGYTDPSRPSPADEETTLRRNVMDKVVLGLTAPVLRYFCSSAHCEEGKEEHEVTMKEYNHELVRKVADLNHNIDELTSDANGFQKQVNECQEKIFELKEDLKREREYLELKLIELKKDVYLYKSKRTLKEMGESIKRETAKLQQIFRKKELELGQQIAIFRLLQLRGQESLDIRQMVLMVEQDVLAREEYANDALFGKISDLQSVLTTKSLRDAIQSHQQKLLESRAHIRSVEEQQMSICNELDLLNKELKLDSNDQNAIPATTSAAV